MDLEREYIVIMLDNNNYESYEYFDNEEESIKYAESVKDEYMGVAVKEIDNEEDTEEIIWESEENGKEI